MDNKEVANKKYISDISQKRKIKVVQFILTFGVGGAENLVKQYCEFFIRSNIDLKVIAMANSNSFHDKDLLNSKIDVFYVNDYIDSKLKIIPAPLRRLFHPLLQKRVLNKFNKEFAPDVIHYHLPVSRYVKYMIPKKGSVIFRTIHTDPDNLWDGSAKMNRDMRDTLWLMHNYSFTLIALHREMKKKLDQIWFPKQTNESVILKNGVNIARFRNLPSKVELRRKERIDNNAFVVGHVGSLIKIKNHIFLLDIFAEILRKKKEAILILVGDGVEREALKQKAAELGIIGNVRFLGLREDIPELMKTMDILIFPSLVEGLSITLIEAQISSLKILASDNVSIETKISNFIEFFSLKSSAEEWADKAISMWEENNICICNEKDWDLELIVKRLEYLYRERIRETKGYK